MNLNVTPCRNCEASGLELQPDGSATCRFCGTALQRPGVTCPACEEVNAPNAEQCSACHAPLFRACPACGTRNWAGATACSQCGRALDLVEFVSAKWRSDFREDLKQEAGALKAQEESASQVRMSAMLAQEERRQQALQQAAARQQARQAQLLTGAMIGVGVFVVVIVIGLIAVALTR